MEKQVYITDEERKKCKKVADVYSKELETDDIVLLSVERYGYVMLQYNPITIEIDAAIAFTDSKDMFEYLWEQWFISHLIKLSEELDMEEIEYKDIFKFLPYEMQNKILQKKQYFAEKAEIATEARGRGIEKIKNN